MRTGCFVVVLAWRSQLPSYGPDRKERMCACVWLDNVQKPGVKEEMGRAESYGDKSKLKDYRVYVYPSEQPRVLEAARERLTLELKL